MIDEICARRLPEHLTSDVREHRRGQRAAEAEHAEQIRGARERLEAILADEQPLTSEQIEHARDDVAVVHGRYSTDGFRLVRELEAHSQADSMDSAPADADAVAANESSDNKPVDSGEQPAAVAA